jgi:hypothetical protein
MKIVVNIPHEMPVLADLVREGKALDDLKAKMLEVIKAEIAKHQGTDLVATPHSVEIHLNGKSPKPPGE